MNIIFGLVSVTLSYALTPPATYEACYQKAANAEVCVPMTSSPHIFEMEEDTFFDFYVKINGVESVRTNAKTSKKKAAPPTLIVGN